MSGAASNLNAARLRAFLALEPALCTLCRQCDIAMILIDEEAEPELLHQIVIQIAEMAGKARQAWYRPERKVP